MMVKKLKLAMIVMMVRIIIVSLVFLFCFSARASETSHVVLQVLDKITARTFTVMVREGEVEDIGNLQVIMHHCDRTPPTEPPESTALLEIGTGLGTESAERLFFGWMFKSAPAVNSLTHSVYDVWVNECKNLEN